MEGSGNRKQGRRKKQKLSLKFALTCILPASVMLIILCMVSIMITKKTIISNMKHSLNGMYISKSQTLLENIEGPINGAVLPQRARVITESADGNYNEAVKEVLEGIKNTAPIFANVQYAELDTGSVYTLKNQSEFDKDSYWYDESKLDSGVPYYAVSSIVFDQNQPLVSYVYSFSRHGDGNTDSCFILSLDNRVVLRTIELTVAVDDKKWMIISDDNNILYHSLGYNEQVFKDVEKALGTFDMNGRLNENFNGSQLVVHVGRIEKLNNMGIVYVVPVARIVQQSTLTFVLVIIFTVISIAIITFFILFMTRKIVNEINDIRASLKGISTREYSENLKVQTQDEIGELVEDFNKAFDELRYQAEHDNKTNFYNSQSFMMKASRTIKEKGEKNYAVIRVDIDNFSFINDIFDWEVGDQILVKIANILRAVFDGDSVHGYLGNDIFVVLFSYHDRDEMLTKIFKTNESIKECEDRIHLVPHFGIADNVSADADMSVICDYAGIALKTIKGNLLETYAVYDEKFDEKHNIQKFVESNKQKALENKDFYILLQPKCDIETGQIVGAEALVRWRESGTDKIISPGKFIPIFEKNGFIITLDRYVWEETCKVIKKWRDLGYRDIPVSVNVSRMHIYNPGFAKGFEELVRKYDIPPELLEVEITESALIGDDDGELERVMNDLKSRGFKLLMDDFASGYSSLIALQQLPFDVIKIDKALIDNINEPKNTKFVSGTVAFLIDLEKEIVVEGVEHEWQKEILKETGSRVVQGYCFSRPIPVDEFEKMAFGNQIKETEE